MDFIHKLVSFMYHKQESFELSKSCLKLKFKHVTIATYDVTIMVGTACEFFRRHFGWKVFVISLLYRTFKERLKIQGHHPFKLGFGFRRRV